MIRILSAALFGLLAAAPAYAGTVNVELTRSAGPTNVDDSAGRFQYTGGDIILNGVDIGDYFMTKRVIFNVTSANEYPVELVLNIDSRLVGSGNITLKGMHSFSSGDQSGGIAAASASFSVLDGGTYVLDSSTDTLSMTF